jgi:hypothetical protein
MQFLKKYWWAIVLAALVGWSGALVYFTFFPPETAIEREIKIRAGFLEPKQAKDVAEAGRMLKTVNQHVRQLPADPMLYRHILVLLGGIGNGVFTEEEKQQAEQAHPGMRWGEIESDWLGQTAAILGLPEEKRPSDLKAAAALLEAAKKEIEKKNNEGFNKDLEGLLEAVEKGEGGGLLERANEFLAKDVVEVAKDRLILMGPPAVPALVAILEQAPSGEKGARVYEVILNIIAGTRLTSLNPADLPRQVELLRKEFGEKPDAGAIGRIKEWLGSPVNRELLGK